MIQNFTENQYKLAHVIIHVKIIDRMCFIKLNGGNLLTKS